MGKAFSTTRTISLIVLGATILFVLGGCRTGPLAEFAYYSPWLRAEWEKDEAIAPTMHKQLAELRAIKSRAHAMTPEEKAHAVQILVPHLNDSENPLLRLAVADTLGQIHSGESFAALKTAMQDSEIDVRIAAVRGLAQHPAQYAVPVLSASLAGDTDLDVRIEVIRQLGKFSDPTAVRAIATALDDQDPAVQFVAVQSLESSTQANVGNNVPAWRSYLQDNYGIASGPSDTKSR